MSQQKLFKLVAKIWQLRNWFNNRICVWLLQEGYSLK